MPSRRSKAEPSRRRRNPAQVRTRLAFAARAAAAAALITSAAALRAPADTKIWSAPGDGLWSDPANWSPIGVPAPTDDPLLTPGTNATVLVTYDASVPASSTAIRNLVIDAAAGSLITLGQTANTLGANSEIVGNTGLGVLQIGGDAVHTVSGTAGLTLGSAVGSSGTLVLSGGSLSVATLTTIGSRGSGAVIQTGGTLATRDMMLAVANGSLGTYTLTDGMFLASGTVAIGSTQSTAGPTGIAIADQSGGMWYLSGTAGGEIVGPQGAVNLTGGTHIISGGLSVLAYNGAPSASATFNVGGSATLIVSGQMGLAWDGAFNQTGGSSSFGSNVISGAQNRGIVNVSGGLFQVTNPASVETVSLFYQSGGTRLVSNMFLGKGTYNLSAGTLIVSSSGTIGASVTLPATFNQTGGTAEFANNLNVSAVSVGFPNPAFVAISGGSFSVTGGATSLCSIGRNGTGTFSVANALTSFSGSVVLGGSDLMLIDTGRGVLNVGDGALVTVAGTLELAASSSGSGTVNLSGGSLAIQGGYIVGSNGPATFNMTGGLLTATGTSASYVGRGSIYNSFFNQSGGTHIVSSVTTPHAPLPSRTAVPSPSLPTPRASRAPSPMSRWPAAAPLISRIRNSSAVRTCQRSKPPLHPLTTPPATRTGPARASPVPSLVPTRRRTRSPMPPPATEAPATPTSRWPMARRSPIILSSAPPSPATPTSTAPSTSSTSPSSWATSTTPANPPATPTAI
jgi:hypothetical protein